MGPRNQLACVQGHVLHSVSQQLGAGTMKQAVQEDSIKVELSNGCALVRAITSWVGISICQAMQRY